MQASEAIAKLSAYTHKERKLLPWLKGRPYLYDCAAAVSWVLNIKQPGGIISCGELMQYFINKKQWHTRGIPQPGDIIIFDWNGTKYGKNTGHDHTGICITADKKNVHYVSADSTTPAPGFVTTGGVMPYNKITGYGRPTYERKNTK